MQATLGIVNAKASMQSDVAVELEGGVLDLVTGAVWLWSWLLAQFQPFRRQQQAAAATSGPHYEICKHY